jgi:hypothetical protein
MKHRLGETYIFSGNKKEKGNERRGHSCKVKFHPDIRKVKFHP